MKYVSLNILFLLGTIGPPMVAQSSSGSAYLTPPQSDSFYFKNEWPKAISGYEKALQTGTSNALILHRLAYSYQHTDQLDKAIQFYYKSLAHHPNPNLLRVATVNLAKSYSQKNNMDSTTACVSRAIAMGYANLTDLETALEFNNFRGSKAYIKIHDQLYQSVYPCITQDEARWFDFWVGDWKAYVTGTSNLAGLSKIEKIAGECAILENWTSTVGTFNGKSINFYNTASRMWEQHWVGSSGGYQKFDRGEYKEGAMRFKFTRVNADNTSAIGKFTFFNIGPNEVRQLSESSVDEGKTWTADYDFTYIRVIDKLQP